MITKYNNFFDSKQENTDVYYHGTVSKVPFDEFSPNMDGRGYVTPSRKKYGGFFFTSEKETAKYYTEYLICRVRIKGVEITPELDTTPSETLNLANENNHIYKVENYMDGYGYSDIVVVPYSKLENIEILGWEFIGGDDQEHIESYYDTLDEYFELDGEISQDSIKYLLEATEGDLATFLSVPILKKYYESKPE